MRPCPLKVIPSGNPIEKLSARFVVLPPAWVTSGSTKPKCPPIRVGASALVWATADGARDISKTPTATQTTAVHFTRKAAVLNVFSLLKFLTSGFNKFGDGALNPGTRGQPLKARGGPPCPPFLGLTLGRGCCKSPRCSPSTDPPEAYAGPGTPNTFPGYLRQTRRSLRIVESGAKRG